MMHRRAFVAGMVAAMAPAPPTVAQQTGRVHRVAFVSGTAIPDLVAAFRDGLRELGWKEPEQFVLEERFAEGQFSKIPTIAGDLPDAGGLMSYRTNVPAMFRRAASYVDRILKGAAPGDLPVEQATVFELVINRRSANSLGLTIPPSLLLRADHVIE
jgi:ABC-type uncharacterized transport system substrate-binding protein